jgi:hypothetical protein
VIPDPVAVALGTSWPAALAWPQDFSYAVFGPARTGTDDEMASVDGAPVRIPRHDGSLVPIGDGRFLVWGGQATPPGGGISERVDDGAIFEVP